ncbi:MAG: S-layer homology domain-containing protein [Clostridia bacterium]|nr:S-layer homology domain-containing protein [Clostridia bacterium]
MKKRVFSMIVALVMFIALLPVHALALSGAGSAGDPYVIASAADWDELAAFVAGGGDTAGNVYLQTADIVEPVTTMIGNEEHPFKGIYDGGGHTLNVNITGEGNTYFIAPFSAVENAQIKRLVVDGSVTGYYHTAGLAGRLSGTNEITDVLVKADITLTGAYGGGVIGHGLDSTATLEGVAFTGSITGGENVGGIWGWSDSANVTMINCFECGTYTGGGVNPMGLGDTAGRTFTNVIHTSGLKGSPARNWGNAGDRGYVFSSTEDVTLYVYPGEYSYKYETSGIELHEGAMVWEGVYAVKKGTTVSLTAEYTGSDPDFSGVRADVGTLVGEGPDYTIVMPGSNVLIYAPGPGDVPYVDAAGEPRSPVPAKDVTGETVLFDGGWYAVTGEVTVGERIYTSGDVNLILCDGAALTASLGIDVPAGASLTIWQQEEGTGTLVSTGSGNYTAGIGGTGYGGTTGDITINGGVINATGGEYYSAGIGTAGYSATQGTVTINAGTLTVYGQSGAAAIGGSTNSSTASIVITGGTIDASCGSYERGGGAVIGSGYNHDGGTIDISGGVITVSGGYGSPGIGGGGGSSFYPDPGDISISGDNTVITAHGGREAAGIGSADYTSGGSITISGGTITASSGENESDLYSNGGAGIGSGYSSNSIDITITGGMINATGDISAAGIGGGYGGSANVTITGGVINATGGNDAAGIGGGYRGGAGNIKISGGEITASSNQWAAGIGVGGGEGSGGNIEISGGKVRAFGGPGDDCGGAGIGGCNATGNNNTDPITITISGGDVYAEGSAYGAGIGTGNRPNNDVDIGVTISGDAVVTAVGHGGAAAIGGGREGKGQSVSIEGGLVTAAIDPGDGTESMPAEAIGHGSGNGNSGTLALYDGSVVFPSPDASEPFTGDERYTVCRSSWARITSGRMAVPYVDENGGLQSVINYNVLMGVETVLDREWYVSRNGTTFADRITVDGDVNLILTDGSMMKAQSGITVPGEKALRIYGQSALYTVPGTGEQTQGTGALIATTPLAGAYHQFSAIGGEREGYTGDIFIHGGVITALGQWGAGIGGGDVGKSSGSLTVTNGYVEAAGKYGSAGIGGGGYTNGSDVKISGGYVVATGSVYDSTGQGAPGIGSGRPRLNGSDPRNSGTVSIVGGTVIAKAGVPAGEGVGSQAIGVNLADAEYNGNDRIHLGEMMVYGSEEDGVPVMTAERIDACHGPYAKITWCGHSFDILYDDAGHWGECRWCGNGSGAAPHEFGAVVYDWGEDDHSQCTATLPCTGCDYKITETVNTTYEVKQEATCGEQGETIYTAVFENPEFGTVSEEFITPVRDPDQCPGRIFTDMPKVGNWAHDPIDWAVTEKVTSGMTKTTFGPSLKITRGQVVTFLWRAAGSPEPTTTKTEFKDLRKDGFYYKAVLWAVEKGIAKGMTKTAFEPDGNCTRGQIVAFMYRYAGSPAVDSTTSKFTDVKKGAFYETAVAWAVAADVTAGTSKTTFSPNATCTRAQTVTFLYRLVKNLNK